ncbi:MAG TPA: multicopper oxidase family protein [Propionibacteriaceae bacterium]|nr:multicopper oxidase family protein [Propionibacteriaceae bacterium]
MTDRSTLRRRLPGILAVVAALAVIAPVAFSWQASLVPKSFSVMDMGYADFGGGPTLASHEHGDSPADSKVRSVSDLVADPKRRADVRVNLVARQQDLVVGGRTLPGYTLNGRSPGPEIRAVEGQLVEVLLRNESVAAGVSLHWHGVDVPNAMDGVAGVTQDAVLPGKTFRYRFVADQAGTFWYHSHQRSDEQVAGGLLAPLVVLPRSGATHPVDVAATAHTYGGVRTVNGEPGTQRVVADPGQGVRLRVINTDNGPMDVWSSAPYRVLAVDGTDLHVPTPVKDRSIVVTAGSRADLEVTVPRGGSAVRVQLAKATDVVVGPKGADVEAPTQPKSRLDLLTYGKSASLAFDATRPDRRFEYDIGRRPGFVRGRPGLWWSINGNLFPNVPMYTVREGDVVVMRIRNRSGEVHPMHLHGHHAVVLARNGVPATGSPWWVDSLDVLNNETYDLAFVADNPGVWADHCHNLRHAAQGMIAHLMYEGVSVPYQLGGPAGNQPE